jgi:glycosyltransferase involved in cell wall biosynthesis
MKILLLTDIPPCKEYTGGIVLDQLCRFVPRDSIVCYCIHNSKIKAKLSPDLSFPVEYCHKPRENWGGFGPAGKFFSPVFEKYHELIGIRILSRKVTRFGKSHGVDRLWCVLQGQTMIRLATQVAGDLQVPLITQVWDPPYWWLRANKVDPSTSSRVIGTFAETVRKSKMCATASVPMAEEYRKEYGANTIAFLPSLRPEDALTPSDTPHRDNALVIGIAGQVYALEEWDALIRALNENSWELKGRQVRIRHVGDPRPIITYLTDENLTYRIEFCGWHTQQETIRLLSETDIVYCPYWFDPRFENEARLSFPSKLTTYYASGRPVLFHGPPYASPAKFIESTHSGICCYSLDHEEIIKSLLYISENPEITKDLTQKGREAFQKYLTFDNLKQNFMEFIQSADENGQDEMDRISGHPEGDTL